MKKVTIKDIANIAGVSRGTVDRVINERGNVASKVKEKILKIAKDLGYEKNLMASSLAFKKIFRIAIVCPDPKSDAFWALPRKGIKNALSLVRHYGIIVDYFDFNLFEKDEFVMQMENALKTKPDAILTAPVFTLESLDFLEQAFVAQIPLITINTEIQHPEVLCYIGQNSYNSGFLAGRLFHLILNPEDEIIVINLGHNIANAQHYTDKIAGLQAYLEENKLDQNKLVQYEFDQFGNQQKLLEFWEDIKVKHPKMKGLFFTNSRAFRIASLFTNEELEKFKVVGFDMIEENILYLKKGGINFIINQNPIQQGYSGIMAFVNHFVLNKKVVKVQYLPLDIVIKENVDFYIDNSVKTMKN